MLRATFSALCLLWSTAAWSASPRVYALIIAENRGPEASITPLKYADDDGVRYFELFNAYANQAELLTVLDTETQRQNHGMAAHTVIPTRDNVLAGFARMNEAMRADAAAGEQPVFYLVYTGHGGVDAGGEGFVTLHDGKLTRTQLYDDIVARSAAAYNHLIIDACDSYLFVNARGGQDGWVDDRRGAPQTEAVAAYVSAHSLEQYPNTGVLLSTSRASESHEWSRYGAGVFSHEVRSALVGSADVNGDGRIVYSEIAAYVAAANLRVDDPKAHLDIFARPPPMHHAQPLFDLRQLRASAFLQLDAGDSGHMEIEDDRGVRYADFNKAPEHSVAIGLLPEHGYYVRREGNEMFVPAHKSEASNAAGLVIKLAAHAWQPRSINARDATSDAYAQQLYAVPYGPSFYQGYVAVSGDEPVPTAGSDAFPTVSAPVALVAEPLVATATLEQPASLKPWAIASTAVSAASAAGAILTFALRSKTMTTTQNSSPPPTNNGNGVGNGRTTSSSTETVTRGSLVPTYVLAGTAVATGVTALVLFLVDEPPAPSATPRVGTPSFSLAPLLGGGAFAMGTFSF